MNFKSNSSGKAIDLAAFLTQKKAADWFAKLRNQHTTEAEMIEFQAWLAANQAHQQAYREIENFWNDPKLTQSLSTIPLSVQKNQPTKNSFKRYRIALPSIAACFILIAFILRPNLDCLQADYCTQIGEMKNIELADGSLVTLNAHSAINVNLSDSLRHVELVQGEALFEVKRNPAQPFIVKSNFGQTQVLGTQFVVRENKQSDSISVIKGIVAVSQNNQQPTILKRNDQVTIRSDQISPVQQVVATNISAWTKGHLVVNDTNLDSVIKEIGRYRKGAVLIKNKQLRDLKVNGRFDIRDTNKAFEALEQTLPIKLYRLTPWLTVIA